MTELADTIEAVLADPLDGTGHCALLDRLTEETPDPGRAALDLVLKHPDSDGPRLLYAEWCARNGQKDRADFIRVQCELARPFAARCRHCAKPLLNDRIADGCPCNSPRGVNHGIVPAYVCTCPECDPEQTGSVRQQPPELIANERFVALLLNGPPGHWGDWCRPCDHLIPGAGSYTQHLRFVRGFVQEVTTTAQHWLAYGDEAVRYHPISHVSLTTQPGVVEDFRGLGFAGDPSGRMLDRFQVFSEVGLREMSLHRGHREALAALRLRFGRHITFTLPS